MHAPLNRDYSGSSHGLETYRAGVGAQLFERMVRVEEELKTQRELMDERFTFTKDRFAAMDKRFEDLIGQVNSRFGTLTWMIGIGFVVVTSLTTVFAVLA